MTKHELKCWPESFQAIWRGEKRHEVRKNDRGFNAGDVLLLREWVPEQPSFYTVEGTAASLVHRPAHYTGKILHCVVRYVTLGGSYGLPIDLCVMTIEVI